MANSGVEASDNAVFQISSVGSIPTNIGLIGGTEELFYKSFKTGLLISSSGTLTVDRESTLTNNGTMNISGILKYDTLSVNALLSATSSLTTNAQWQVSGSFIGITAPADHIALLGSPGTFNGYVFRYMKRDSNSNLIMIRSTSGISGQTQWSSSDAYASIEVVAFTLEWIITSKVGNWY